MSITNASAHDMKQHHKSRSTQNIKLDLEQLTISRVDNHCINNILSGGGGSSSSNSSSPTYTLSTPTTPPSPPLDITPTLFTNSKSISNKSNNKQTTTTSSSTRLKSSKSSRKLLKKQKKKAAKLNIKSSKIYRRLPRKSNNKITAKLRLNNATSRSNGRKNKRNAAKKHQRFSTESNLKRNKIQKKKKTGDKKRRNTTQSAKKHLKLVSSYSERTRIIPKKNYYYSNPCDIFSEKPMSRRSNTFKRRQTETEKCTKKKGTKKKKGKKTMKKNKLKPRRKRPRPLSSRLSDKKSLKSDEFERKTNKTDDDIFDGQDNGMQYVNYDLFDEVDDNHDIEQDLDEMLSVLKQDSEQDITHLPLLSLSHSLSDRIDIKHKSRSKRKRKLKLQNGARLRSKTPLTKSKPIQFPKKTKSVNNNTAKRNKKHNKAKHKKPSLKPYHSNNSNKRKKSAKQKKAIKKQASEKSVFSVSNHPKGARSMDITLSYSDIARGVQRPASSICAKPPFFNKINEKRRHKSPTAPRSFSKSQHATPTSPFWPNKPLPTLNIDVNKTDTKATNASRRNTIALLKKKTISLKSILPKQHKTDLSLSSIDSGCTTSSISLGALSHYFQYHANHETKSILAQLAGIIMELVGEPNVFHLTFRVSPEMQMAIRRNKLRISPILRRGLVLSFAMHSVPQPLHDEYHDEFEMEQDYDHTLDMLPSSELNMEQSPPAPDLPESDLGLTSTDDDDEDEDDDDIKELEHIIGPAQEMKDNDNEYIHNSDNIIWQSDGYETSHFIDFNSSTSSPAPAGNTLNTKKTNNNNTLSPTSIDDAKSTSASLASYGLTQSQTKTTNTPSLSPGSPRIKHTRSKSNSDIFTYGNGVTPDFDNVELLRSEKKHIYQSSSGSFSSFSIGSPHFNTEITSNCMSYHEEESFIAHPHGGNNKSFGSDMTVISVSNTTVIHHNDAHNESEEEEEEDDGMVFLDDDTSTTLKLEQKIRTPFSNTSDIDTEYIPDHGPLPCIGYSSSGNVSKAEVPDMDAYDLCVYATNVLVPNVCEMKARPSAKILLSQTSHTGDDSGCIPYCNYDDDEAQILNQKDTNKLDKISFDTEHLQLSTATRSSKDSIPGIGTIQVTTPGNQHTHTIFDKNDDDDDENQKEDDDDDDDDEEDKKGFDYMGDDDDEENFNEEEDETFENIEFPYYQWKKMEDAENDDNDLKEEEDDDCDEEKEKERRKPRRRRVPSLVHRNSNSRSPSTSRKRNNVNNACNIGIEPDSFQSIVFETGAFRSRNISMISSLETMNENGDENVIKFTRAFNKMVADDAGNIFIGTDKYIRYVTYNKNDKKLDDKCRNFRYFRKQEKLLYELRSDEHLVSLWNQNGKIYFVTMPYALADNKNYREYKSNDIRQWSLNLFVVENKNNLRQKSIHKYEWIPPSVHDKLPYRKLRTFRWKVKGRFIENFLSIWYDEKYETLITLAECDRLAEPQIIFLNKKNDRGLLKLKIRNNIFSIYGSDDSHGDDGVDNHLLIRHKPTKSWLCCVSCVDYKYRDDECWIQFKLNRENNCILSSKIIKLPMELRNKKWLTYDKHRDCLIGINRLNIEQLLGLNHVKTKQNEIKLTVLPRLTKLLTKNACDPIKNTPSCRHKKRK